VTKLVRVLTLIGCAFALVACGGEKESEAEEEGRAKVACEGPALSEDPGLPANFPKPDGVTYTKASEAGPSRIVDGYYEGELQDAYDAYKEGLSGGGYTVLFDEIEEDDSEVSYEGEGRTGQVALREECEEEGRLTVHITSRPE
jgi:hypothetical protein